MNLNTPIKICAFLWFIFTPIMAHADRGREGGVTLLLEYIEIKTDDFVRLSDRSPTLSGARFRSDIQDLIELEQANIKETILLQGRARQNEFEASQFVHSNLSYPYVAEIQGDIKTPQELPRSAQKKLSEVSKDEWSELIPFVVGNQIPRSFNRRDIGDSLSIAFDLKEGRPEVDITLISRIQRVVGDDPLIEIGGHSTRLVQPRFFSHKIERRLSLHDGVPVCISASSPIERNGAPERAKKIIVVAKAILHEDTSFELGRGRIVPEDSLQSDSEPRFLGAKLQFEYIRLPHDEISRLLLDYHPKIGNEATTLREKVQKLIDSDVAQLEEISVLNVGIGGNTKFDSIKWLGFPNKYKLDSDESAVATEYTDAPIGVEIRMLDLLENSNSLSLEFSAKISQLTGSRSFAGEIKQPLILKWNVRSRLNVQTGVYTLAAIHSLKDESGYSDSRFRTMLFIKAIGNE